MQQVEDRVLDTLSMIVLANLSTSFYHHPLSP